MVDTCKIARPTSRRDAVHNRECRCSSVAALLWNANLESNINININANQEVNAILNINILNLLANLDARQVMIAPRPDIATSPRRRGSMHRRP